MDSKIKLCIIMSSIAALGCLMMFFSYRLGVGALTNPGPGMMPMVIGAVLVGLTLWSLLIDFSGKEARVADGAPQESVKPKKFLSILVSLILFAVLMEPVGFPITAFLFLFFTFWVLKLKRNAALIASAATALVIYFGFGYIGIRFPPGLFRYLGFY